MALSRPTPPRDAYARYSVLEYLLIGDLRDLLEEPATTKHVVGFWPFLESCTICCRTSSSTKTKGAISRTSASEIPTCSNMVERLHREHEGFVLQFARTAEPHQRRTIV